MSEALGMGAAARPSSRFSFDQVLWLMPAAFAVHIVEEYAGDFADYVAATLHGSSMSHALFLINNALFMALLAGASVWATRSRSRLSAFVLMAWASGNLFWDFFAHLTYTVVFDRYSPGLITASLIYYPLPVFVTWTGLREGRLTLASAFGAYLVGGLLILAVIWGGVYHFKL